MEKADFLGIECYSFDRIDALLNNKYTIFVHSGNGQEYARVGKTKVKILTEDTIAKEYLYSGRGVCFGNKIYFKVPEDKESVTFRRFKVSYAKRKKELEEAIDKNKRYLGGALYYNLVDVTDFPIAKSILLLLEMKLLSEEEVINKLGRYLKPNTANIVVKALNNSSNSEIEEVG